jgi:hypothetical protein
MAEDSIAGLPNDSGFAPPVAPEAQSGLGLSGDTGTGSLEVIRSLWFCFLMLFGSLGLWGFAWIWHTAKEVTPRLPVEPGADTMDAGLRTGLFWVPILNWVITYWSWRDTKRFADSAGVKSYSPGWFVAGYIGFQVIGVVPILVWASLFSMIFPIIVQNKLNESWRRQEPQRAVKAPLMTADWIPLGIGLAFWSLLVLIIVLSL